MGADANAVFTSGGTVGRYLDNMVGDWQVHRGQAAGRAAQPAGGGANHRPTTTRRMPAMCQSHIAGGGGAPAAWDAARSSSTMPWRSCMVCKIRAADAAANRRCQQLVAGFPALHAAQQWLYAQSGPGVGETRPGLARYPSISRAFRAQERGAMGLKLGPSAMQGPRCSPCATATIDCAAQEAPSFWLPHPF